MKLKQIITALSLGLAAMSASATPLDSLVGDLKIKLGGLTTESKTTGGTNETTWGVGSITEINSLTNGGLWQAGSSDGSYLYYMLYGIADARYQANTTAGFDIYNIGATGGVGDGNIHLDIYRTNTRIMNIDGTLTAQPGNRTGYDMYSAYSGLGPAYLKLTFGTGIVIADDPTTSFDERLTTLFQDTRAITLPTSGDGAFFADVVGGTAMAAWDTNGQAFGHDWSGNFTLRPNFGQGNNPNCTQAQVVGANPTCFAGLINDPVITSKVPEPASLALFGLGLAGVAGLRRRRRA